MVKKLLSVFMLAALLVICGGQNGKAEAYNPVYVGSYSDGSGVWLMPDTVYISSRSPYSFTCTVHVGSVRGDALNYSFYPYNGSPYYRNSEGYSGYVHGGQSPVAANIYRYVVNNW